MKSVYVNQLRANEELVNEPFLLQDLVRRETKDGRPFLLCTLRDKSGTISAVFWDVPQEIEGWAEAGLPTLVTGSTNLYKGTLQIRITDLNPLLKPDMADFLPASQRSREAMEQQLQEIIANLKQPWQELLRQLLLKQPFYNDFINAPAARSLHHAYVGGLLEHTLSMATIGSQLAEHYPYVNKDLLISGILLHDMGKVYEYATEVSFNLSDDGRLVGHIVRAVALIEKAAASLDNFPQDKLRHLIHLVASHHGTQEWGSPVIPKTLEAILLHQIDLLDSRVQGFFDHLANDNTSGSWTAKSSYMFNSELYKPPDFE